MVGGASQAAALSGIPGKTPKASDVPSGSMSILDAEEAVDEETRDTIDEGEADSFEDPYTYSDDSASLSDAYFRPDDDLARPARYREEDPLRPGLAYSYPMAAYYGSLHAPDHPVPPLWVAGSIQEDAELLSPFRPHAPPDAALLSARRDRRKHKKIQRRANGKQRERMARERAVAMVRGKPQHLTRWQDPLFAALFLAQLCLVVACAVHFGYVLFQKNYPHWYQTLLSVNHTMPGLRGMPFTPPPSPSHRQLLAQQRVVTETDPIIVSTSGRYSNQTGALISSSNRPGQLDTSASLLGSETTTTDGNDDDGTNNVQHTLPPSEPVPSMPDTANAAPPPAPLLVSDASLRGKSPSEAFVDSETSQRKSFKNKRNTNSGNSNNNTSVATSYTFTIDYKHITAIVTIAGFYACILTYVSFGFMMILARALIQIILIFSVLLALAWGVIGLTLDPYGFISIMGFLSLLLTLGYSIASWNRIPFAATNLHTAACAMRCTTDITILALLSLLVAFAWCIIWTTAFVGIVNNFNRAECNHSIVVDCQPHINYGHIPLYIVLLISFHWTNTVIKNIVRATVASAIGTWWFHPNQMGPFCTNAVLHPLVRSLTQSLGSICLGSLVAQPVRLITVFGQCCCFILGFGDKSCLVPRPLLSVDHPQGINATTDTSTIGSNVNGGGRVDTTADGNESDSQMFLSKGGQRQQHGCSGKFRVFVRACNRWSYVYIGLCKFRFVCGCVGSNKRRQKKTTKAGEQKGIFFQA